MHYRLPELKIKLAAVEDFLKEYGASKGERMDKLTMKRKDLPQGETRVVVLNPV